MRKINVIGVGMVPFAKPGKSEEYNVMAAKAAKTALADAAIPYNEVEQAYAGYVFGDSTCGQRAVYVAQQHFAVRQRVDCRLCGFIVFAE